MRLCCVAGCTSPSCSGQDGDGRAGSQFVGVSTGCYSMHANVITCSWIKKKKNQSQINSVEVEGKITSFHPQRIILDDLKKKCIKKVQSMGLRRREEAK